MAATSSIVAPTEKLFGVAGIFSGSGLRNGLGAGFSTKSGFRCGLEEHATKNISTRKIESG